MAPLSLQTAVESTHEDGYLFQQVSAYLDLVLILRKCFLLWTKKCKLLHTKSAINRNEWHTKISNHSFFSVRIDCRSYRDLHKFSKLLFSNFYVINGHQCSIQKSLVTFSYHIVTTHTSNYTLTPAKNSWTSLLCELLTNWAMTNDMIRSCS